MWPKWVRTVRNLMSGGWQSFQRLFGAGQRNDTAEARRAVNQHCQALPVTTVIVHDRHPECGGHRRPRP